MISNEIIEKTIASMKSSVDVEYFFSKLMKPDWITPLFDKGLFNDPPEPIIDGGYIKTPVWPISQYLLRMSEITPDIVSDVILKIPDTDNERIHQDYVESALNMPCEYAVKIANNESKWIKKTSYFSILYPDYIGKLISYLSEHGQVDDAYKLAKYILELKIETKELGEKGTDNYFIETEVIPKFSQWEYIRIVEKHIPQLIISDFPNYRTLKYLCDLLKKSLEKGSSSSDDYSYVWRPNIGDSDENRGRHEIRDGLLTAVRDAAISIVKNDMRRLSEISNVLISFDSIIFERIALYLLSEFPSEDSDLTAQYLVSKDWFFKHQLRVEYACLARKGYQYLSDEVKSIIMSWVDEGPDLDEYRTWYIETHNEDPDKDILESRKKRWQRDRLDQFKDSLDDTWGAYYLNLVSEYGAPESPEYLYKHTSWVGPTSPKTVEDIDSLDVNDLVQFLISWQPNKGDMEDSPEGLSRTIADSVKNNLEKYAENAALFVGVAPTYVRGVLDGFRDGLSKTNNPHWGEVLKLGEWVVKQEVDEEKSYSDDSDEDPNWSWCRKSLANVLDTGLKKGEGQIPIDLKENVWALIHILIQDPDPTPAHEAEYGGSNMGPTTLAINTVRGEAMHALVEYGLWVARNTTDKKISFDDIPEMRQVLDDHLDPEIDPSLAIRSVYGQFYPWLNLLDSDWANEAKVRIFSDDELGLGDAAWDAYITFCQPYDDTFKIISDIYKKYAERLSGFEESDDRERTLENLAAHLITFYWRSKLEIDDEIVQLFYQHAPLKLRKYAIEFIGRSLGNNKPGELEANIEKRLKDLYEWRQTQAEETKEYEELEGFCWWIDADIIDREWTLNKFHELLQVQDKLDALDFAARKLNNYLEVDPIKVLDCMDMMIDKLNTQGMYFTWDDSAQEILRNAIALEDAQVKDKAIELIHKFGSCGYLQYRDLLSD